MLIGFLGGCAVGAIFTAAAIMRWPWIVFLRPMDEKDIVPPPDVSL